MDASLFVVKRENHLVVRPEEEGGKVATFT
jgi:hypothetical protein